MPKMIEIDPDVKLVRTPVFDSEGRLLPDLCKMLKLPGMLVKSTLLCDEDGTTAIVHHQKKVFLIEPQSATWAEGAIHSFLEQGLISTRL